MPSTVEGHIWQALVNQVQIMDADIGLKIEWHGKNFTAPKNKKYLRVQNFFNQVQRTRISSDEPDTRIGQLQISVHWPLNVFAIDVIEVAGQVATHWPKDLALYSENVMVRVTKDPELADIIKLEGGLLLPVTIYWTAQG